MKKVLLVILSVLLIGSGAFASEVNRTMISETQLDDDPTSVTGTWNVQDYVRVGFFVKVDETEVGNAVSTAVTMHFSYDNTNWVTGYFYDLAGGSTLQTSETIAADAWYYCWLDTAWSFPHVRVTITATNTDADDLSTVTCYLVGYK